MKPKFRNGVTGDFFSSRAGTSWSGQGSGRRKIHAWEHEMRSERRSQPSPATTRPASVEDASAPRATARPRTRPNPVEKAAMGDDLYWAWAAPQNPGSRPAPSRLDCCSTFWSWAHR
jgi:hypothetical protein